MEFDGELCGWFMIFFFFCLFFAGAPISLICVCSLYVITFSILKVCQTAAALWARLCLVPFIHWFRDIESSLVIYACFILFTGNSSSHINEYKMLPIQFYCFLNIRLSNLTEGSRISCGTAAGNCSFRLLHTLPSVQTGGAITRTLVILAVFSSESRWTHTSGPWHLVLYGTVHMCVNCMCVN